MRLEVLREGLGVLQKLLMVPIKWIAGNAPGPIVVMSYRRELFGKHFAACLQEAMRGSTCWSKGELELFGAFVSKLNKCRY